MKCLHGEPSLLEASITKPMVLKLFNRMLKKIINESDLIHLNTHRFY